MTHRSPALRMLLVCAVLLLTGQFAGRLTDQLISLWMDLVPIPCRGAVLGSPAPNAGYFCTQLS